MLALSPDGRLLLAHDERRTILLYDGGELELPSEGLSGALGFDDQVWLLRGTSDLWLARVGASGLEFGQSLKLPEIGPLRALRATPLGTPAAVLVGSRSLHIRQDCEQLIVDELADHMVIPIAARRTLVWNDKGLWRGEDKALIAGTLGPPGLDGAALFDGNAVVLVAGDSLLVVDTRSGAVQQRIHTGEVTLLRVAQRRGWAAVRIGATTLCVLDLRLGHVVAMLDDERPLVDLAVDAAATVLVAQRRNQDGSVETICSSLPELLAERGRAPAAPSEPSRSAQASRSHQPRAPVALPPFSSPRVDLAALCRLPLRALGTPPSFSPWPRAKIDEHLEALLDLVGAWCKRALALGWDSGRIGFAAGPRPFEDEAAALLDGASGRAAQLRADAEQRAYALEQQVSFDRESPLGALADEYRLSPLAQRILLIAVAPQLRGELARAYALVANDPERPICDELLVAQLLDARGGARRDLARELDADAPLVRHGLVTLGSSARPFAAIDVLPVVARRVSGEAAARCSRDELAIPRAADRALAELVVPPQMLQELVLALHDATETPPRIVLRARPGMGGTTLLAALAAQAGRTLGILDMAPLAARGEVALGELRRELRQAALRGLLPCLVGTESLAAEDPARRAELREIFAAHPGPLAFRLPPAASPPLHAGYLLADLQPPSEAERVALWRRVVDERAAEELAAKHRVGPGTITRVAAAHRGAGPEIIETALRRHRETAIGEVATRVHRLASWSNVVLPVEIRDSIREFIGRVAHRRTVYESWGYDRLLTSSRGLTALFSGGPGTGKSMVAGIIARELGYELYRVDLSRVLSKWVGETEKNLARVFDAAEDGEVVLLFDEADSLFAKRTSDVRSANDRYANLEVNYLLERIDQFDGIAILTTNSANAIDAAFKRRLSFRLSFPFPDEELREELWRVHLPATLPVEGELDLRRLAGRFQLSGGYIRNAAVRAAFLAAQEGRSVTQEHLERAVVLEYREVGKLIEGGVLE